MVRSGQAFAVVMQLCLCLLVSGACTSPASAASPTLRLCHTNQGDYPWTLPDRPGLNDLLIRRATERLDLKVTIVAMPWARCLFKLTEGSMDGAFNASFRQERLAIARFPMKNKQPDASRRLMQSGYTLYRLRGSKVQWDGTTLKASGIIGVPNGFSGIAMRVKDIGGMADQRLATSTQLLNALAEGRYVAVALKTEEGTQLLKATPALRKKIEAIRPPLAEKDFFLMFSVHFDGQYPGMAENIWNAIAEERESPGYRQQVRKFR